MDGLWWTHSPIKTHGCTQLDTYKIHINHKKQLENLSDFAVWKFFPQCEPIMCLLASDAQPGSVERYFEGGTHGKKETTLTWVYKKCLRNKRYWMRKNNNLFYVCLCGLRRVFRCHTFCWIAEISCMSDQAGSPSQEASPWRVGRTADRNTQNSWIKLDSCH